MLIFTSFEISKHYLIISKSKQMLYLLCYDVYYCHLYSMLQINNKEKIFLFFLFLTANTSIVGFYSFGGKIIFNGFRLSWGSKFVQVEILMMLTV